MRSKTADELESSSIERHNSQNVRRWELDLDAEIAGIKNEIEELEQSIERERNSERFPNTESKEQELKKYTRQLALCHRQAYEYKKYREINDLDRNIYIGDTPWKEDNDTRELDGTNDIYNMDKYMKFIIAFGLVVNCTLTVFNIITENYFVAAFTGAATLHFIRETCKHLKNGS